MKPEVHKILTEIAIDCCGNKLSKKFRNHKMEILQGTKDEDEIKFERFRNWYFYKSNDNIPDTIKKIYGTAKTTSLPIFKQRICQMNIYTKQDKEYYNYLGRILHHIHDMNTPSHVVPIYHGPIKHDYFESFMLEYMDRTELGNDVVFTNEGVDFISLYKQAAKNTLDYVENEKFKAKNCNNETINLKVDKFWRKYDEEHKSIKGFGTFGDLHLWFK